MPTGTWIITSVQGGGNTNILLRNCSIVGTSSGYKIMSNDGFLLDAPGTSTSLPVTFNFINQGISWTVTVLQLTPRANGTWSNNYPSPESESGTWESGVGEEEEGDAEGEEGEEEGEHSAD